MKHDLEALKSRLLIPEVWQRLGLAGTPGNNCRSPFRADRKPSFSIYDEGKRWMDQATGEGGDVIDFIALACAVDKEEATRRFIAMAGGGAPLSIPPLPASRTAKGPLALPRLHRGTVAEIETVARSRNLSPASVSIAQSLGTLAFGDVCGPPCWILSDAALRVAEARRVDGKLFPPIGNLQERKPHSIRGSTKSWPVGVAVLRRLRSFRAIMMVEGGPDYLAALHFCLEREVHDVLPIAMLGRSAGSRIDPEALALLKRRRVRIFPHNDADGGGVASAEGWAEQLCEHGCEVDLYPFDGLSLLNGKPVKDLNDCTEIVPADEPQLSDLLP